MKFVSEDTVDQAKQALTNMGAILEAAGSSLKNGIYSGTSDKGHSV